MKKRNARAQRREEIVWVWGENLIQPTNQLKLNAYIATSFLFGEFFVPVDYAIIQPSRMILASFYPAGMVSAEIDWEFMMLQNALEIELLIF